MVIVQGIQIIVGIVVYGISLVILNDEWVVNFLNWLYNKVKKKKRKIGVRILDKIKLSELQLAFDIGKRYIKVVEDSFGCCSVI